MSNFKENYIQAWSDDSTRIIATPSQFARNTLFYVQEIGHFRTFFPYFTEREGLDSLLLAFTVSGNGELTYMGETYKLSGQQIFFIDCANHHHYRTAPGHTWELLWVHFNGRTARGCFDLFMANNGPVLDMPPDSNIPSAIDQMIRLQTNKSLTSELLSSKWLTELITACLLESQPGQALTNEAPDYIQSLIQEISRRYAHKLTLDGLARQFAVSKYHMIKEFKRYTGFTPNEYIINTRLTKAKEWLRYSDRSVADIAEEVGIDNVSHFINLFKTREGSTPLAYRKQWQQPM